MGTASGRAPCWPVPHGDLFLLLASSCGTRPIATERAKLRGMIGDDAEQLTFLFGTLLRSKLLGLHELMQKDWNGISQPMPDAGTSGTFNAESRLVDEVAVTAKQVAKILVVTIADYMEQMVEVCGAATPA